MQKLVVWTSDFITHVPWAQIIGLFGFEQTLFSLNSVLYSLKLAPVQTAALDPSAYCETPVYNPDLFPNILAAQA